MNSRAFGPVRSLVVFARLVSTGRVSLRRDEVGQAVHDEVTGNTYTVFRSLAVDGAEPVGAELLARFEVTMRPGLNRLVSLVTLPFFVGLPGFRSKRWMAADGGRFAGLYGWQTRQDAERYAGSFAARFMQRRALPGTFRITIRTISQEPRDPTTSPHPMRCDIVPSSSPIARRHRRSSLDPETFTSRRQGDRGRQPSRLAP